MNKKLEKTLKEANIKLKKEKIFLNYQITIDGDFTNEYNEVHLENKRGSRFPIAWAETENEAIAVINAYMTGLSHGKDNSYPQICDKDNY